MLPTCLPVPHQLPHGHPSVGTWAGQTGGAGVGTSPANAALPENKVHTGLASPAVLRALRRAVLRDEVL